MRRAGRRSSTVWAAVAAVIVLGAALSGTAGAGAGGGTFTTTTSTTRHTTTTRVDLDDLAALETRVSATLNGVVVFDQTVSAAPDSGAVTTLLDQANTSLTGGGACTIAGPVQTSGETSDTELVNEEVTATETSVTTSTTFGPATILVGEDQSVTFFVAPGTTNVNVNTHTETFVTQTFQTTNTTTVHLQLSGVTCEAVDDVAVRAEPIRAEPRTNG